MRIPDEVRSDWGWSYDHGGDDVSGLRHPLLSDTPFKPVTIQPISERPQRVNRLKRVVGVAGVMKFDNPPGNDVLNRIHRQDEVTRELDAISIPWQVTIRNFNQQVASG